MDSTDTDHVNPNWDPTNLWMFPLNETIVVGKQPHLSLKVTILERERAFTELVYQDNKLCDWLNLNKPCVVLRNRTHKYNNMPALTITLRVVMLHDAQPTCGFQITSNLPTIPREQPK